MRWSKLKTWILCATAVLSVGALGISVHSVKQDTELMEVVAESIASSTASVTFNLGKAQINGHSATVNYYDISNDSDPYQCVDSGNYASNENQYGGTKFGGWGLEISIDASFQDSYHSVSADSSSVLTISHTLGDSGKTLFEMKTDFVIRRNASFIPLNLSLGYYASGFTVPRYDVNCSKTSPDPFRSSPQRFTESEQTFSTNIISSYSILSESLSFGFYSFKSKYDYNTIPKTVNWHFKDLTLVYTTPELQFAAACSAYRNLGFTYDKNDVGEFTAFMNPRLRFKLNLPSDYSAYIDNENVSVRVKFKNGEAYSEMVLEGSTFMSDGSGGYTCTFSLTNIPPEHFQDEISFIPIIEGMDLVEQTGTYRTPKCCVITLGASVKSMVDAYRGDLYSSLTEAQQEAITAFAEYYATYLA